ncbi:dentin sialophospho [Lasius niger]|uniref:Dentin sialophospho n=1 Tax=Lasius niger TaxID=67767 RepID=A0A0J7LAS0_LASNI|nr:dentin sialophospho [Lasius niger]
MRRNEKWFENFGATTNEKEELHSFFGTAKSRVYIAGHAVATNMEQFEEDQEEKRMVHVIRNFVEKIVEGLIENVDDTSIDRLYKNSEYDKFLEEHRPPLIAALTRLATCLETSLTSTYTIRNYLI